MELFKPGNPALNEKAFQKSLGISDADTMTEKGALNKFLILVILLLASASFTWKAATEGKIVLLWMIAAFVVALIVVIVLVIKPSLSPYLAPIYALLIGVFLGGISVFYNDLFLKKAPNLIINAVGLTFGILIAMLALFKFRIIKPTEKFKAVLITAIVGIGIFYSIAIMLRLFLNIQMPLIHESSPMGIVFSLIVVSIASLKLILDFDMIERGSTMGAPKYMEWYCGFGLLVTIVWLYIEILRLLSKFARRN